MYLVGPEEAAGWSPRDVAATLAGLFAIVLTVRAGGRVVRMLLAAIFSCLAVQATRNANFFGLVAGFVIASNLGEWTAAVLAERPVVPACEQVGQFARAAMSALTVVGIVGGMTGAIAGAYGGFYRPSLREHPLVFAHAAARFAGRPGMPARALAFDLRQSSVYLFHNGPGRKVFMDPRLEVASRATFESYVRLEKAVKVAAPRWATAVRAMGDPLVLLGHEKNGDATATLMAHPSWRCVYFDAVASVFLPAGRTDLTGPFPTVDFAARHFAYATDRGSRGLEATQFEALALNSVAWVLRARGLGESAWAHRIPVALCAFDLARTASSWWLTGDSLWNLCLDPALRRPGPSERWDPALGLTEAQATYCFRRELDLRPTNPESLSSLQFSFDLRGMNDARDLVARFREHALAGEGIDLSGGRPPGDLPRDLSGAIAELLRLRRPMAAAALARAAEQIGRTLPWETADRVAVALLHLGDPASARRVWDRATAPTSFALRLARIGEAELASLDFAAAARSLGAALEHDPQLGEAWFALALLRLQSGDAAGARSACREGLVWPLTEPQRFALEQMLKLAYRPNHPREDSERPG